MTAASASELLERARHELSELERSIRAHHFLDALDAGEVPRQRLEDLAAEQFAIVSSDRRSFAHLAARFPVDPAGSFFLGMASGEGEALQHLLAFASWLGLDAAKLRDHEPAPGAQAYAAFVAWLALNGSRADVVLAFLANLAAWGENCGRVAGALRSAYGAPDESVAFFDFFATPPPGFEQSALAVLEAGLAEGESPERAIKATKLLQAYELAFWDAMADEP